MIDPEILRVKMICSRQRFLFFLSYFAGANLEIKWFFQMNNIRPPNGLTNNIVISFGKCIALLVDDSAEYRYNVIGKHIIWCLSVRSFSR